MNLVKCRNLTKLGGVVYPQGVIPNTIVGGAWVALGGIFGHLLILAFLTLVFFKWPYLLDGWRVDPKILGGKCISIGLIDGEKKLGKIEKFYFRLFRPPNFHTHPIYKK